MNNSYNEAKELKLDVKNLIWKLIAQWKAILIVCILMGILIPSIRYAKDSSAYKSALADKASFEEQASVPVKERIDGILQLLSEEERQAVMIMVQEQEMIDMQQDYLDKSIMLNLDPVNQKTLSINYLLKSDSGVNMKTLVDYYDAGLRNDDFIGRLRELISPDSDLKYIYELVNNKYDIESPVYSNANSVIYVVSIMLPEEADAEKVALVVDSFMDDLHNNLITSVGDHSIKLATTECTNLFNNYAVERKNSILTSINSLNNAIKNSESSFSEEQRAAYESIVAIMRSSKKIESKEETVDNYQKPVFRKNYVILGFILGALLYAIIYVVLLIISKTVASARTAQSYTSTRLLGEVYTTQENNGISNLFSSKMVAKWRFKNKLDVNRQINSLVATLEAVCLHHKTNKLALLLTGMTDTFERQVESLVDMINSSNSIKSIEVLNVDEMDERSLASVKDAVYMLSSKTKVDSLNSLMALIKDYEATPLGSVYFEEV